uniref:Uncharacterized protein n=1 Tax=Anguilla anguilla TaxID=7936 RepID=A0A0E9QM91_ANGAN
METNRQPVTSEYTSSPRFTLNFHFKLEILT